MSFKIGSCVVSRLVLVLLLLTLSWGWLTGSDAKARTGKEPNAEELVERAILVYGSRAAIYTIQRNGILRSQVKFITPEGTREGRSTVKFIRKPLLAEDLRLIELELPEIKFVIGFDGKQTWSTYNGEKITPSPETVAAFRAAHMHSYEALLRYKENQARLQYVTSKPFGPSNELDVIDMIYPDGARTRYEISRRTARIIYLEYEMKTSPQAEPTKYRLYFKDFQYIQNSLVPFVTVVFENGRQVEERKLVEVAYNVQLEEKVFKAEPSGQDAEAATKP
jgi:hypothetical protein